MSYVAYRNYGLEIAKGNISGSSVFNLFARNPDVDTGTIPEDVWANGGIWVPPTAARVHDIVSTSVNDTSAGTGVRTVLVTGLNGSYAVTSETITMNGTTNVPTANSYIFIQSIVSQTAGSGGTNAGIITATAQTDATVSAAMAVGYGRTTLGVYQVPASYSAYITSISAGFQQGTASSTLDVACFYKPFGGVYYLLDILPLNNSGTSNVDTFYENPIKITEKGIIKLQVLNCSANNNDVHGNISIILVQN